MIINLIEREFLLWVKIELFFFITILKNIQKKKTDNKKVVSKLFKINTHEFLFLFINSLSF